MVRYGIPPPKVREAEENAYRIENDESSSSKDKRDAYLKAGKGYEDAGFITRAIANYKDALKFTPEHDKKKIRNKISYLESREGIITPLKVKGGGIEKRFMLAILSVVTLALALFFTSVSLTGYSVFELTQTNSRFIGTIFFICGLVFTFLYLKRKK